MRTAQILRWHGVTNLDIDSATVIESVQESMTHSGEYEHRARSAPRGYATDGGKDRRRDGAAASTLFCQQDAMARMASIGP